MLNIKRFVCNEIQENTYIVSDETREAIVIDCGAQFEEERRVIRDYVTREHLTPKHLLSTHGHVDHHLGDRFAYDTWGLKPEVHKGDESLILQLPQQAEAFLGVNMGADDFAPVGRWLEDGDKVSFGSHAFTTLATPGHSPGGVLYYCEAEHVLFTGDTLFRGSIGRTDFAGGSMFMIIQSLRMVSQLPDETIVYPGHGEPTTIGDEVANNPYLDR